MESFAEKLDDGMAVRRAWLEAVEEELSPDDNRNRAAVFFLETHENDTVDSHASDWIHGSSPYDAGCMAEYHELDGE